MFKVIAKFSREYPGFVFIMNMVLSASLAFAKSYLFKLTPESAFSSAILFALLLSVAQLCLSLRDIETKIFSLESKISLVSIEDAKLMEIMLELVGSAQKALSLYQSHTSEAHGVAIIFRDNVYSSLQSCINEMKLISSGNLRIIHEEKPTLWYDIINNISTSYFTTNVTREPNGSFGRMNNSEVMAVQSEAVKRIHANNGSAFVRLFITETDDLDEALTDILRMQKTIGIDVRIMKRDKFNALGFKWFKKIGTPDFAIIDDQYLYLTHLENETQISHVEITNDKIRLSDAHIFTQILISSSKRFLST